MKRFLIIVLALAQVCQVFAGLGNDLRVTQLCPLALGELVVNAHSYSKYDFATKRLILGNEFLFVMNSCDGSVINQSTLSDGFIRGIAVDGSMIYVLFMSANDTTMYSLYSMDKKLNAVDTTKMSAVGLNFIESINGNIFIGSSKRVYLRDGSGIKMVYHSDKEWTICRMDYDDVDSIRCIAVFETNDTSTESKVTWINSSGDVVATYRLAGFITAALHDNGMLYLLVVPRSEEECPSVSVICVNDGEKTIARLDNVFGKQLFIVNGRIYVSGSRCYSGVYRGMAVWPLQPKGGVSSPIIEIDHNSEMSISDGVIYYFDGNELKRFELKQ